MSAGNGSQPTPFDSAGTPRTVCGVFFALRQKHPTPGQRLTALAAITLVLALSVLSASPTLHAWLHDETPAALNGHPAPGDHGTTGHSDRLCAVTLFASGVLAATLLILVARFEARAIDRVPVPIECRVPWQMPHRLPPHGGPPQA